MKRLIAISVLALLLVAAGCDLFGLDQTRGYITGTIYTDSTWTVPAEGIWVFLQGDTTTVYSQSITTDVNGVFLMEIDIYPEVTEGEGGGVTYSFPDEIAIGIFAVHPDNPNYAYVYGDKTQNPLTLGVGDTLYLWPIDLEHFNDQNPGGGGSGGGGS